MTPKSLFASAILVLLCSALPLMCFGAPDSSAGESDVSASGGSGRSAVQTNCALLASAEARALSSELVWEARTVSKIAVHAYQLANITIRIVRALKGSPEVRSVQYCLTNLLCRTGRSSALIT